MSYHPAASPSCPFAVGLPLLAVAPSLVPQFQVARCTRAFTLYPFSLTLSPLPSPLSPLPSEAETAHNKSHAPEQAPSPTLRIRSRTLQPDKEGGNAPSPKPRAHRQREHCEPRGA